MSCVKFNIQKQIGLDWTWFCTLHKMIFIENIETTNNIKNILDKNSTDVNLKMLYQQTKKKTDCSYCHTRLNPNKLGVSVCGHLYCLGCLKKLKNSINICIVCKETL